ncbi:MAG: sugar-binding protein [Spirochaetota bacterium]
MNTLRSFPVVIISIAIASASIFPQTKPAVELLFNGDLKNTGTLGGEAQFDNPIPEEAAKLGGEGNKGFLDLNATLGGIADKTEKHGGTVVFTAPSIAGSIVTIQISFTPATADELPRTVIDLPPGIRIYSQQGVLLLSASGKSGIKWLKLGIDPTPGKNISLALVVDGSAREYTLYENSSGVAIPLTQGKDLPEELTIDGSIAIGNKSSIRPFKGTIDTVRIWNAALAKADLGRVFAADESGAGSKESGGVALLEESKPVSLFVDSQSMEPVFQLSALRDGLIASLSRHKDGKDIVTRLDYTFADSVSLGDGNVNANLTCIAMPSLLDTVGMEFSIKASDPRAKIFVRLGDKSGQTHQHALQIANSDDWQKIHLAFDKETFPHHWGGAGNGIIQFPVKTFSIAMYRGTQAPPGKGYFLIKDTTAVVNHIRPEDKFNLAIETSLPGGVVFVKDKALYRITAVNRVAQSTAAELVVRVVSDDGNIKEQKYPITFSNPGEAVSRELSILTAEPRFYGIHAWIMEKGKKTARTQSGCAVVNQVPNYGRDDPNSFFGTANWLFDAEACERIGVKNLREFVWLSRGVFTDPEKYNWSLLDQHVDEARAHGMQVVLTPEVDWWWGAKTSPHWREMSDIVDVPDVLETYRSFLRAIATRYKGKIAALEIQNEPNNETYHETGYTLERGSDLYSAMIRVGREEVEKVSPGLPIIAIGVSGRDFHVQAGGSTDKVPGGFKFTQAVLPKIKGAMDIYGGHPYSHNRIIRKGGSIQTLEDMNVRGLFSEVGDLLEKNGFQRRFWSTEIGYSILGTTEAPDEQTMLHACVVAQGLILCKTVPGFEKIFWFIPHFHHSEGDDYSLFRCNMPQRIALGGKFHDSPHPVFATPSASAYASTAFMLHNSAFVREVSINSSVSAWRFDRADGKSVVSFWARRDGEYRMDLSGPTTDAVNMFGRIIARGTSMNFKFTGMPMYLVTPKEKADDLEAALGKAKVTAFTPLALKKVFFSREREVTAIVQNNVDYRVDGILSVANVRKSHSFAPLTNSQLVIALPAPVEIGSDVSLALDAGVMKKTFPIRTDFLRAGYVRTPTIDGSLTAAAALDEIRVDSRNFLYPPDAPWKGMDDLSVKAYAGWNEEGLYFAARVKDDRHEVPFDSIPDYWKSDSIQLALDYEGESLGVYDGNDREIGLVIGANGPKASLYTTKSWLPLSMKFAGRHENGVTTYEAFITWKELDLPVPAAGKLMPMSFIVNENDGQGRGSWMGLTAGIGESKAPVNYRSFLFAK